MTKKLLFTGLFFACFYFKTMAVLVTPTLNLPADKAIKQATCNQMQIKTSTYYSSYVFEYATNATFTNSSRLKPDYTGTSFANCYTKPLAFNTKYYWRVKALHNGDSSAWTNTWSFTTDSSIYLLGPDNKVVNSIGLYFAWSRSTRFSKYFLELDTSQSFNSKNYIRNLYTDTFKWFYMEYRENRLKFNRTYYWRLKGFNGNDSSNWTAMRQFTTTDTIRVYRPISGENGVKTNLQIDWGRDNLITYQIDYDTTPYFNTKYKQSVYRESIVYANFYLKHLDFDQKYYWRIRPCGYVDTGRWSITRDFTVAGMKNKVMINTASGIDSRTNFSWQNVDSATIYQYQIDTLPTFSSKFLMDSFRVVDYKKSSTYNRSFTVSQLPFNVTLYQRVRPIHAKDTGSWSRVKTSMVFDPTMYYPYSNFKDVPIKIIFGVKANAGVTAYRIQRDISPNFNSGSLVDVLNTYNLPIMKYNTVYYWRLKIMHEKDTSNWSTPNKFNTQIAPILKSPTSFYTMGPGVAGKLDWDSMPGTSLFEIQYDTNSSFNSGVLSRKYAVGDSSYLNIKDLYFGKVYYWRVRAIQADDTSQWSSVWYFYTYNPPRLSSPPNKQKGTTFISLDWASINGTTGYHYLMSKDSLFTNPWEGKESKSNPFFHYFTKNPTQFNTKYFWKIRVFHTKDTSDWSQVWNFTTRPRNGVKITYPGMNQTGIPLGVNLQWDKITDATQYVVEYSEKSDMAGSVFSTEFTNLKTVSLKPNQTYYWRVLAKNKDAYPLSDSSEIFVFTTDANFVAPILSSPANLTDKLTTTVSFSWLAVRGATYDISIAQDANFDIQQTNAASNNGVTYSGFKTNTAYYWKVRAKNSYATGPWSSAFTFKTATGAGLNSIENSLVKVYPNPTNSVVTIELPKGYLITSVSVLNFMGQEIETIKVENLNKIELNVLNFKKGIYLFKIKSTDLEFIHHVVIN